MLEFKDWLQEDLDIMGILKNILPGAMIVKSQSIRTVTGEGKGKNVPSALKDLAKKLDDGGKSIERLELLDKDGEKHTFRLWLTQKGEKEGCNEL